MLCEECKINEATIHFEKNLDGIESTVHICQQCAASLDIFKLEAFFQNFINSMFFGPNSSTKQEELEDVICDQCNLSYSNFQKYGRLGCANCYTAFSDNLNKIFKNVQSSNVHQGKVPKNYTPISLESISNAHLSAYESQDEYKQRLREEIDRAVAVEDYASAAALHQQLLKVNKGGIQ